MAGKGRIENLTNKGKGRPKGAQNKFTTLKHSFLDAFEKLENTEGKNLFEWAKKNQRDFYSLIARMLPKTIEEQAEHILAVDINTIPEELKKVYKEVCIKYGDRLTRKHSKDD